MNLAIRGIEGNLGERNADSFADDLHKDLRADFILANPPYNLKEYWQPELEGDPRWIFGHPDPKNANYAWLELMYSKLAQNGKAAILMPNGATTSNGQYDHQVRKNMVDQGKVDAIIDLPGKLFSNTGIGVQCWILNKGKSDTDVLFISAQKMGKLISRKIRVLEPEDIKAIADTYHDYKDGKAVDKLGFSKKASLKDIEQADYSLSPGRYVGVDDSDKMTPEEINEQLKATSLELNKLFEEGDKLEEKVKEILKNEIV